jgi:membrane associated rhomboid family serine protease
VDNAAHIGGALAGALLGWRLHPVILEPASPEQSARLRRWLGVVAVLVGYTVLAWLASAVRR